jgi:hypothetical protein
MGEGMTLSGESGEISDGPGSYADNADCTWTIVPSDGAHAIRLEFTAFDMEQNYDYVKIFSKAAHAATPDELHPIAELTGTTIPPVIFVNGGDSLVVKLTSDGGVHNTGFAASFRAATAAEVDASKASEHTCFDGIQNGEETGVDCGGACDPCGGSCSGTLLVDAQTAGAPQSGVFTDGSDIYVSGVYDSNRRCNFFIKAPADKLVVVGFNRLDTEDNYDFVYAYDTGYDGTAATKVELGEFTGAYTAQRRANIGVDGAGYIISSGPGMMLRLESDSSVQSTGFEVSWSLRDNPDALAFDLDVAAASATYAVIGLVVVMGAIGGVAMLAQLKMARKNNRLNKQIISRTEALKSSQDDERSLLEDDLESFPVSEGTKGKGVELQEIKVSTDVKPPTAQRSRGITFPGQSSKPV